MSMLVHLNGCIPRPRIRRSGAVRTVRGYVNERGAPFNPKSVGAMLGRS